MDEDERFKYVMVSVITGVLLFVVLLSTCSAKQLARWVEVSELSEDLDSRPVAFSAFVRSCEARRGRMGSNFVLCRLGVEGDHVKAMMDFKPVGSAGSRVVVKGIYHKQGRFGGLPFDHFVVADVMLLDWNGK